MARRVSDEQIAVAVKKWPTSMLVMAVAARAKVMMNPYDWHGVMQIKWGDLAVLGKEDIFPMVEAASDELDRRMPVP